MEEKEGDYIPPEREDQVVQLAKSVSKEEDDISDNEVTEERNEYRRKEISSINGGWCLMHQNSHQNE